MVLYSRHSPPAHAEALGRTPGQGQDTGLCVTHQDHNFITHSGEIIITNSSQNIISHSLKAIFMLVRQF